jgi:AcrR family transcriptional regulator
MPAKRSAPAAKRSSPGSARPSTSPANGRRPRLGRSTERWQERQREVVDTAAALFAERGYHATSIEDLVQATGLQRGGLYHYIDSKADLLIQIHERFIEPLLAEARAIAAEDGPADVVLRKLAVALMNDIASYRDQVTVFLHEWRVIESEAKWKAVRKARKEFEGVIEQVLRRGVDQGVFQIPDVRLAVLGFLGMFNYSYQWFRPGGRVSPQRVADYFCDIYLTGISA